LNILWNSNRAIEISIVSKLSPTYQKIDELTQRSSALSAHLNLEEKQGRLEEVLLEMEMTSLLLR
jgi:hypothetical protein